MKKFLLVFLGLFLCTNFAQAADQVKVMAIDNFRTDNPTENISVRVLEDSELGIYNLEHNSVLNCKVLKIVDPKRGKRNASFYVKPLSYSNNNGTYAIEEEMYGKYFLKRLTKEELKKIKPTQVAKSAALTVGNHFMQGLSTVYYFGEGMVKNEEGNRLKSGTVKAYKKSPLSYVEEGEQLDIKTGDSFYFVFKTDKDVEKPNYTYEEPEETSEECAE